MNRKGLAALFLLIAAVAPASSAQIERVEMRVQGMT